MSVSHAVRAPLAAAFIFLTACSAPGAVAETHIVEMRGLEFFPAELEVSVGDTVTWVNADVTPHTATAAGGGWDSGAMEQGAEWSLVIDGAGRIDYVCTFHPTMTGVIIAR